MASAFTPYKNSVLTFKSAGARSVDPITGNMTFERSPVIVEALLQQKTASGSKGKEPDRLPGVDLLAVYLEGYAVEPMALPSAVKANSWAECVWDGKPGRFYLLLQGRNPFLAAVEGEGRILGDIIKGWFQTVA